MCVGRKVDLGSLMHFCVCVTQCLLQLLCSLLWMELLKSRKKDGSPTVVSFPTRELSNSPFPVDQAVPQEPRCYCCCRSHTAWRVRKRERRDSMSLKCFCIYTLILAHSLSHSFPSMFKSSLSNSANGTRSLIIIENYNLRRGCVNDFEMFRKEFKDLERSTEHVPKYMRGCVTK